MSDLFDEIDIDEKKNKDKDIIILEDKSKTEADDIEVTTETKKTFEETKSPNIGEDGVIEGNYIDITEINKTNGGADFDKKSYYSETILNENKPKKGFSSFKRFIAGILIASIVGGPMVGIGVNIAKPLSQNIISPMLDKIDENNKQAKLNAESSKKTEATTVSSTVQTTNISPASIIAKNVGPAVVCITNTVSIRDFFNSGVARNQSSSGSGIIFHQTDDKVFIVTNNHVISASSGSSQQSIVVTLAGDQKVEASIVGSDADTDLAVLSVNKSDMSPESLNKIVVATFGDSTELQVGELAVAIGNPLGEQFSNSVTQGIISGLDRRVSTRDRDYTVIQTDAAINEGNSGGALVNSKCEVIGINTIKLSETGVEGMGFAIPTSIAKPVIEELMSKGYISKPSLGIVMERTISEQLSQLYGLPVGVMINSIVQGSGAEKAGLQAYDIITEFNGEKVTSTEQLSQLIKQHKIGDIVTIKYVRYGKNDRSEIETKAELQDSGVTSKQNVSPQSNSQQNNSQYYEFSFPFGFGY